MSQMRRNFLTTHTIKRYASAKATYTNLAKNADNVVNTQLASWRGVQ